MCRHQKKTDEQGVMEARSTPHFSSNFSPKFVLISLTQEDLQNQALNINSPRVITMCEVLERRIVTKDLPYDLDEPGGGKGNYQRAYETLTAGVI